MSLERVAAWVAEKVLPFLVRTSQGGEAEKSKAEETTPLAAQITKVDLLLRLKPEKQTDVSKKAFVCKLQSVSFEIC